MDIKTESLIRIGIKMMQIHSLLLTIIIYYRCIDKTTSLFIINYSIVFINIAYLLLKRGGRSALHRHFAIVRVTLWFR
jgi:hypothetical protein